MKKKLAVVFALLFLVVALPIPGGTVSAWAETVYVACIDDFSGPYAYSGKVYLQGIELALKDANYTVLGKKIELITRDTELKPPIGVKKLREVVEKYHPFFVFQSESSSVGLAVAQEALNLKTPIFVEGFASQITGEECNRYVFRWDSPNFAGARSGLVAFLKLNPQVKTFYAINDNNASAKDMMEQQENILKAKGGKIIKNVQAPLGNADFSSILTEVLSLKPDALVFNCYGTGNTNLSKQVYEFGISQKMPVMSGFGGLTMLRGLPPDAPEGIYYGVNWWHTYDNPWSKNFAAKYKKEYGANPEDIAVAGYMGMWMALQTAEKVKSLKVKDLILGLEKFGEYDGPTGREFIQAWDHQVVHAFLVGRGKAAKDKIDGDDYLEIVGTAKEYPNPTSKDSTCTMKIKDADL